MADTNAKYNITKLTSENYFNWRFRVEMLLKDRDLWSHIKAEKPENVQQTVWNKEDDKAFSTIALTIADCQIQHIRNCKTAKEAWNALENIHQQDTPGSRVRILRNIMSQRATDDDNIEEHINRVNELFQKLFALGEELKPDFLMSATFLGSLPCSYDSLITALEARDEKSLTPTLVKAKVIEEYRRRSERDGMSTECSALKVTHKANKKFCTFCKKVNHVRDECHKYTKWLAKKQQKGDNKNDSSGNSNNNANVVQSVSDERHESIFVVGKATGWLADSGCTTHISKSMDFFVDFDKNHREIVSVANGHEETAKGKGTVILYTVNNKGESSKITMNNVLYVPEVECSLLSVRRLDEKGFKTTFGNRQCMIKKNGIQYAVGDLKGGQYVLRLRNETQPGTRNECKLVKNKQKLCVHQWHRVFGHRDMNVIKNLASSGLVYEMHIAQCPPECKNVCDDDCSPCAKGKLCRLKVPKESLTRSNAILDLIHSDICGPFKTATPSGKRWLLTFIDDYSRYTTIYLLNKKSEAFEKFKEFKELMQTQFEKKIKCIRTDRGGEYMGNLFLNYLAKEGIDQDRTAPYSSFQNGVAERKNRYLVEMTNCMLLDADVAPSFWGEAMHHANFTQNILPSRSVDKTPHELWHGRIPINSYLRRFGAKCYVHVPDVNRTKSDPKADDGIFMGFDMHSKAYRVYVPSKHRIVISRDVRFLGDTHTHTIKKSTGSTAVKKQPEEKNGDQIEFEFSILQNESDVPVEEENGNDTTLQNGIENGGADESASNDDTNTSTEDADDASDANNDTIVGNLDRSSVNESFVSAESGDSDQETYKNHPRQSIRIKQKPERLIDVMHLNMISTLEDEPSTYIEASTCDEKLKWNAAMSEEFQQLQNSQTWVLVDLPRDRKAIGCKWVYKVKKDATGNIQKYKARLVAQGFSQKFGTDYDEVFAPVSRQSTFRIILSISAYANVDVYHFDAKTAFLNGDLKETIFMRQPPGFVKEGQEEQVCLLKKSIYGLKQSARVWNRALHTVLVDAGFIQSTWDQCFYTLRKDDGFVFILVYVDDILLSTNKQVLLDYTEKKMNENFCIENLGVISSYLGIQVTKNGSQYHLNQEVYIKKILNEF